MKTIFFATVLVLMTSASSFAASSAPASPCADENHYPLISKTDLKSKVDTKSAFVIDVNSAESYKDAHVPTAIHFADHKSDFASVLPADKNSLIVAYCGGPQCEAWLQAAQKACELGYTNIQHFKDGISGWKKKS